MATATAHSAKPKGSRAQKVTLDLVLATAEDLKELKGYKDMGTHHVPMFKLRFGMIYWLYSTIENAIQPTPYQITAATAPEDLKYYLDNKMVYIARNPFENNENARESI